METIISSLATQLVCSIEHASDVAAARREGQKLADSLGFSETRAGMLALVVTEAATNVLKHADRGVIHIGPVQSGAGVGIDVLVLDEGPGITDLSASLVDGMSTAGTAGTGLGAMRRQADEFDVYSQPGKGTAFFMRLWRDLPPPDPCGLEVGALLTPLAGEDECGDGWGVRSEAGGATLLAADGLGHGPHAARASAAAIGVLAKPAASASDVVQAAHDALRGTRGAALAVARIDYAGDELRFAGIGNIAGYVFDDSRRALVSHNGIVGHNMRKVQEFSVPFGPGATCILHSDGIQTQWDLDKYPGLLGHSPALVAAVLMRDFIRRRDDAMVLVVRRTAGFPGTPA
ncbi:ATP-binding SpoIIE family protein phosphatase [Massilia yuzhufengensis]|uniref:Anti-sigma regulatory factor (Ser/Thr protein kinase) n=1 Tax=Massilia yuzhufengensis TaxID=1164594 RepID=A0A1I1GZI6_9BURK|nr:ATP-binding SpoIIE family protein phosphatase [Massilia yuzhufengensis]SFC17064.1 Anti-sigma regulatory factor (Ser/Thr protein kinase) [Massilia yuzhufengensis]